MFTTRWDARFVLSPRRPNPIEGARGVHARFASDPDARSGRGDPRSGAGGGQQQGHGCGSAHEPQLCCRQAARWTSRSGSHARGGRQGIQGRRAALPCGFGSRRSERKGVTPSTQKFHLQRGKNPGRRAPHVRTSARLKSSVGVFDSRTAMPILLYIAMWSWALGVRRRWARRRETSANRRFREL